MVNNAQANPGPGEPCCEPPTCEEIEEYFTNEDSRPDRLYMEMELFGQTKVFPMVYGGFVPSTLILYSFGDSDDAVFFETACGNLGAGIGYIATGALPSIVIRFDDGCNTHIPAGIIRLGQETGTHWGGVCDPGFISTGTFNSARVTSLPVEIELHVRYPFFGSGCYYTCYEEEIGSWPPTWKIKVYE
ncbi:MAG TPA: hypothetical protein VNQ76_09795 [Planctomicrobium sp.]|nr:hypothetical protein [Planctomicrobium sp.]